MVCSAYKLARRVCSASTGAQDAGASTHVFDCGRAPLLLAFGRVIVRWGAGRDVESQALCQLLGYCIKLFDAVERIKGRQIHGEQWSSWVGLRGLAQTVLPVPWCPGSRAVSARRHLPARTSPGRRVACKCSALCGEGMSLREMGVHVARCPYVQMSVGMSVLHCRFLMYSMLMCCIALPASPTVCSF